MLEFLARDSFLNNLQTCRLGVGENAFPPPTFLLKEPGYPNYDLWCGDCQVVDGIDAFIEGFVRDGCANQKLKSVCIQWIEREGHQSRASKQLGKPTRTDAPLPKNDMPAWLSRDVDRVSQCEVHSFLNMEHWLQMEANKWSVEGDGRITIHTVLCVVKSV